MKNQIRTWVYIVTALIILLLSACCYDGRNKTGMLLDEEAIQAPHALIRLQEQPVFHMDNRKRPFAMIDDRNDKIRASDKPLNIQESKPE